tara:strand:- start:1867 stop:2103 length:237 start_codon:yes stop_codon:yes gene_type:complete
MVIAAKRCDFPLNNAKTAKKAGRATQFGPVELGQQCQMSRSRALDVTGRCGPFTPPDFWRFPHHFKGNYCESVNTIAA